MEHHEHTLKPYLIQAVYNWCLDTDMTPYLEVVDFEKNKIPSILFENRKSMVFNVSKRGASKFTFLPEGVQFKTKINQQIQSIFVSYHGIKKIYAKELGHGLEFSTFVVDNESLDEQEEQIEHSKQLTQSANYEAYGGDRADKDGTENKIEYRSEKKPLGKNSLDVDSKLVLIVNNQNKDKK